MSQNQMRDSFTDVVCMDDIETWGNNRYLRVVRV